MQTETVRLRLSHLERGDSTGKATWTNPYGESVTAKRHFYSGY